MVLVEGRGRARGEVGMALLDLLNPVVELAQFSDSAAYSHTFAKLQLYQPREILMPNTMCEMQASKLFSALQDGYFTGSIVSVPRKLFSEEKGGWWVLVGDWCYLPPPYTGLQCVRELSALGFETVLFEVQDKYYALAAAAALLKYVEHHHNMLFAAQSLRFFYRGSNSATVIGEGEGGERGLGWLQP
jgi:DNA mismatch repair protein MSH4